MILRAASGWQTITADLALILFLITAQAANETPEEPAPPEPRQSVPQGSSALALHRPKSGESTRERLLAAASDDRQVATISVGYAPTRRAEALAEGERLLEDAEDAGVAARLIAMPNVRDEIVISVDYLRTPMNGTDFAE